MAQVGWKANKEVFLLRFVDCTTLAPSIKFRTCAIVPAQALTYGTSVGYDLFFRIFFDPMRRINPQKDALDRKRRPLVHPAVRRFPHFFIDKPIPKR